ncbi:hypothetical protein EIP86_001150 [Pleurotus ostreatoroseus]|nr:hypothetical protein EIP86_001150 [Pleurotus ostreatoroseus]
MNTTNVPLNVTNVTQSDRAPGIWAQFLNGQHSPIAGLIRVDQTKSYIWMGDSSYNRSVLTSIEITPTRTIMNITAGPIDLSVTFLSPIEPTDPVLQSLPFSYISLEAATNDGQQHDVQVYADITGEHVSGDTSTVITWSMQRTETLLYYQMSRQEQEPMSEIRNQAEDGFVIFAMPAMPGQTYMEDTVVTCRNQFVYNGTLTDELTLPPAPINSPNGDWPVVAFSVDLGQITATSEPLVWAIGMARNPAIQYTNASGSSQLRPPYWASEYNENLPGLFVADYPNAYNRAIALDQKLTTAAARISNHYVDLVSLAARQAMAGTELTVSQGTSDPSQWNLSDIKMFMKNVGTDGRINPVEGLYKAFPFFLYMNATYGGWLLDPVLEFANSSRWPFPYAPQDIDSKANLTNLALKGIIGIQAMAEMSIVMNLTSDTLHYSSIAIKLASSWQSHAVSSDGQHILTSFGDEDGSQALTYNLFADKLLGTNMVSANLYASQTQSLQGMISNSNHGLPIDAGLLDQANSVWSLFTAAYATDPNIRSGIIDEIWGRISTNATDTGAFSTDYSLGGGGALKNFASSSSQPPSNGMPSDLPNVSSRKSQGSSQVGAIAGGTVGGLSGLLLGIIGLIYWRRQRLSSGAAQRKAAESMAQLVPFTQESFPDRTPGFAEQTFGQINWEKSASSAPQLTPSASLSSSGSGTPSSQHQRESQTNRSEDVTSHPAIQNLRTEFENLRRAMQAMHEERLDPPPGYASEVGAA